jgi:hypothetical protein
MDGDPSSDEDRGAAVSAAAPLKLNPEPARKDLTVRECTKLLGGTLGALCGMADKETIERALDWWSMNFKSAGLYELTQKMEAELRKQS